MTCGTLEELFEQLKSPAPSERSVPFWGWNDALDRSELLRQIGDMSEKGLGGFFIHSREGLETGYLSEEWLSDAELCVAAADKAGLEAWLYDEDKWPSGSAGGRVAASDRERFAAKGLTLELAPADGKAGEDGNIVFSCLAELDGGNITRLGGGDTRIILRRELSGPSEWYNGSCPSDMIADGIGEAFIASTHALYAEKLGDKFGAAVKGFFTDEPDFCDFYSRFTPGRPWLPWTDDFIAEFTRRRGYSPEQKLPLLFFGGEGCEAVRHDYWRTLTELFGERYMKPLYDWCGERGLKLTGHMLYENDMGYSVRVCGAAMPQYRYLHMPGVDLLGRQAREYLTLKQCASVARQYGREDVISESYGCTGWDFGFEDQKWLGDWQAVLGVTRRCQHMMLYSIKGCRKRDFPPVFNYQSPWWSYDRLIEDYFARLTLCAKTGEAVRDILVIHPISSFWTKCACAPDEDLANMEMNTGWADKHITDLNVEGDEYNRLAELLIRAHRDFDFGDETILAETGRVEGGRLRVGQAGYSVVIVPRVCSLFKSTLALLREYLAAGGKLIWVGDAPDMTEGRKSAEARELFDSFAFERAARYEELLPALDRLLPRRLSVKDRVGAEAGDILTMLRRAGEDWLLIAVNHDRLEKHELSFELPLCAEVTAYDPWSAESGPVAAERTAAGVRFIDTLPATGSRVYIMKACDSFRSAVLRFSYTHPHASENIFAVLGPSAHFERTEPNALTLDTCSYSLRGSEPSGNMELWRAQKEIRAALGMQQVYYNGAPMRYLWTAAEKNKKGTPFELRTGFVVKDMPGRPCRLAVEPFRGMALRCNGEFCREDGGWYLDRAIRTYALPALKAGENTISVSGDYTGDIELEDMYLLGDFAVDSSRALTREPERLHFGDWCLQGYCNYSGAVIYSFSAPAYSPADGKIKLRLGDYSAALAEVIVNGARAGVLFGRGYSELDITRFLLNRENRIDIKLVATPRNLLGPLHQTYTDCARSSWADFRTEGAYYTQDYVLKPYGLFGQIKLIRSRDNDI